VDVPCANAYLAMMKFILILIILMNAAIASDITDAWSKKDYVRVTEIYREQPARAFNKKELVYISWSLRKRGFYRQDIKLNVRLIKQNYANQHKKLVRDIKNAETIDGEEYPEALKVLYWNLMNDYGQILESYKDASTLIKKDHQHYLMFSKILSELEFREGKVDKYNDKIVAHITYLENKVYKFSRSLSVQYLSWQTESTLDGPGSKTGLVVTNRGVCAGGDVGYENSFYHYYVDGCFFAGSGGVSSDSTAAIKYRQSNVGAYGVKISPGASMIVSSSGSRIGVRLPMIYTNQNLQEPQNNAYSIKKDSPLSFAGSLYSRWQFKTWYMQTEFGKYIQKEQTYWALGLGKNF
jgi:hypothetical protein